jgi:hypothetical protein
MVPRIATCKVWVEFSVPTGYLITKLKLSLQQLMHNTDVLGVPLDAVNRGCSNFPVTVAQPRMLMEPTFIM